MDPEVSHGADNGGSTGASHSFDVFENGDDVIAGNDKATNTFNRHVDKSLVGERNIGGTVWVQVLVGSQKIGQPSEFVTPRNVDALKKDVKEEYVELQRISAACFQVFHSSVTLSGCAVPLAANSVVPLMAIHDDPIKLVALESKPNGELHLIWFSMKPASCAPHGRFFGGLVFGRLWDANGLCKILQAYLSL